MIIGYIFEDLYIWMLEEISFLQKKGLIVIPVCIRPRKTSFFSNEFLGKDISHIAETTHYLNNVSIHPAVCFEYIKTWIISPLRMAHLHLFIIRKIFGIRVDREIKFRDIMVLFLFPQVLSIFKKYKVDHVHCHFASYALTYMYYVNYLMPITHTVTVHAADIFLKNNFRKEKLFSATKILSISNYNREFLIDYYGESIREKITVIHTGTDIKLFTATKNLKTDPFVIMTLALLVEHKGLRYLIEACKILMDRGLNFQLNVYGKGPAEKELQSLVKKYDLTGRVFFKGSIPREEVVPAFHQSSVFVLPSVVAASNGLREGIPQVFKECMACGIPAISTYTGSIPEIIVDGKTGFLVHERDAQGLAEKLEFMITHPDEMQNMSQASRKKIEIDFNIDSHTNKMIEIFKQITGK